MPIPGRREPTLARLSMDTRCRKHRGGDALSRAVARNPEEFVKACLKNRRNASLTKERRQLA